MWNICETVHWRKDKLRWLLWETTTCVHSGKLFIEDALIGDPGICISVGEKHPEAKTQERKNKWGGSKSINLFFKQVTEKRKDGSIWEIRSSFYCTINLKISKWVSDSFKNLTKLSAKLSRFVNLFLFLR